MQTVIRFSDRMTLRTLLCYKGGRVELLCIASPIYQHCEQSDRRHAVRHSNISAHSLVHPLRPLLTLVVVSCEFYHLLFKLKIYAIMSSVCVWDKAKFGISL